MARSTPIVLNHLYRVRYFCYQAGQVGINVLHYLAANIIGAGLNEGQAVDILSGDAGVGLIPMLNNLAQFIGADMQDITGLPPYEVQAGSVVGQGFGTAGPVPLPTQTCGLLTGQTAITGRAYRGRAYLPFPATASMTAAGTATPTAGYLVNMIVMGTLYYTPVTPTVGVTAVQLVPVLVHRKNKAGLTPAPTTIIGYRINTAWATQRRRGNYGRPNPLPNP
jgi:hypothetical protein